MKAYLSNGVKVNGGFVVKTKGPSKWGYPVLNYCSIHAITDLQGTKFNCVILEPFGDESIVTWGNHFASITDAERYAKSRGAKEMYSVSSREWIPVSLFKRILKMIL
jgi:hypothetical protein